MIGHYRRYLVPITFALSISLLAGCWNSRELTDMAFAVGMGIDSVPDSNKYRVTFQIVNSGALTAGTGGQGGTGGMPIIVISEQSDTLYGAIRKISRKVPRRMFFGHIQLVVIGESLAQKGITDLFDFFERSHEVRLNSTVLISRNITAEKVIEVLSPMEKISSIGIAKRSRITSSIWAENVNFNIADTINGLVSPGEPVLGGVKVEGDLEISHTDDNLKRSNPPAYVKVEGISIFKQGKLIGWLDGDLARGLMRIRNEMKGSLLELPGEEPESKYAVVIVRSNTKIKSSLDHGRPKFTIHIKEEGTLGEAAGSSLTELNNRDNIIQIQNEWAKRTEKEITGTVRKAQQEGSDILGFGSVLKQYHAKEWKKIEKDWPELFPGCTVDVEVEAYIRGTGMRGNSYEEKMGEEKAE
ncbi:Ger(x)C family spore germination protein [Paenibacillus sp. M1]|uniref:Ger(X)C family spore germination protein n=1 Tax=Paenibacillus haidiansis TaxID=1574488 RepID=A0ABU7VTU2_9BACL